MTDYEAEHNLPALTTSNPAPPPRHRPDLSTFFSTLSSASVPDAADTSNPHAEHLEPLPGQVVALFDLLAEAWTQMRNDSGDGENVPLLDGLIGELRGQANEPPRKIEGVSESFLEGLERVDKRRLKDKKCPICGEAFLDDQYPLVVVLPCHKDHWFDYECITPWLKLNPTCPLDRKNLVEKKVQPPPADEEEDDYDDYYA